MTGEPTVFLIDDDSAVRGSLAAALQSVGFRTKCYASGEDFLSGYSADLRGCVVADLRMPGISGLEVLERLSGMGSFLPVIVMTGFADIASVVRSFQGGAATFLQKPIGVDELRPYIERAFGETRIAEQTVQLRLSLEERLRTLTASEREVLELLLQGRPNKAIATALDLGLRTVELRRSKIMRKLDAESLPELVRMVLTVRDPGAGSNPPLRSCG